MLTFLALVVGVAAGWYAKGKWGTVVGVVDAGKDAVGRSGGE